jgi:NAD(P)-dependent dehydrogenase (short-subunit alcohol dehydrogenase family)
MHRDLLPQHRQNVLSLLSLASTPPMMTGYSAPKAAADSLTQALRPTLAGKSITVHGVYPGRIDTDMLAGIDAPKTLPGVIAAGILDGLGADRRTTSSPTPTHDSVEESVHASHSDVG